MRDASEQVAEEIQRYIRAHALDPGDRLGTEAELAARFGISRPTLREALRLLASRNLVRANKGPGGGIFVARTVEGGMGRSVSDSIAMMLELESVSIEELVEARALLEAPLARLAAEAADEETTAALREAVEAAEQAVDDQKVQATCNEAFHRAIATAAGNPIVQAVTEWAFDVLEPQLRGFLAPVIDRPTIVAQHRAILRAIEAGKATRAENLMREHLLYLRDLVRVARSYGDGGARSDGRSNRSAPRRAPN